MKPNVEKDVNKLQLAKLFTEIDQGTDEEAKAIVRVLQAIDFPSIGAKLWQKVHLSKNCVVEIHCNIVPSADDLDKLIEFINLSKSFLVSSD